ncbi:MAG TPA: glycosyltransferase [Streptosporangiaceae bacterium]|nr:glycosyltransferase [Streptosporangiaceae bacterium]
MNGDVPLISVVIPVFNVRPYLAGCLDSVLGQPGSVRVEVIAVDDASDDGSGGLLDARARSDDRLRVEHLTGTAGPGNARNTGLARATGRYVWFADGDDQVQPGALDAISAALTAAQPDVLLIDYVETYPDGSEQPSPGSALLREAAIAGAGAAPVRLADMPKLINTTMTAWSKVFRREFLIGLDEPFRPGIHEDIPVSCAALLRGCLGVLDRPCYRYRRSRPGSFMATSSTGHLAVFNAYEEVFAMLHKRAGADDPAVTPAVEAAVFERAIAHYAAVLQTTGPGIGRWGRPGLVPRRDRRRFFQRMHEDFRRYEPGGYRLPGGPAGIKFAMVKRGKYLAYELSEPFNQARVALRNKWLR